MSSDPLTVGKPSEATSFTSPVVVDATDSRLRMLGGRTLRGTTWPAQLALYMQSITNGDPSVLAGTGLPAKRSGRNGGVEFLLPAGVTSFELALLGAGDLSGLMVELDGVATNAVPYQLGPNNTGGFQYTKITLPAGTTNRMVRLTWGWRPFIGLRFPAGTTIAAVPANNRASYVFQGDSITAGSVSTNDAYSWATQAAYRLGANFPINVAVGGSGYLRRYPADTGYNFRERLRDVVEAVDGGPPDAVFVAGGINDCSVAQTSTSLPASTVGAEALAYFQAIRAAAPNTVIFVVGPFSDYNNPTYSSTSAACRDAIFAAAQQVKWAYTIDTSTFLTAANRDTVFGSPANSPHPVDAGHAIYADRIYAAAAKIINGL